MDFINEFFKVVDPIFLTGLVTSVMAFLFNRVPKIKAWFDKKTPLQKQDWTIGFIAVSAVVIFGLDCVSVLNTNLACEPKSIADLLYAIVFGGTASQATHMLTKRQEG